VTSRRTSKPPCGKVLDEMLRERSGGNGPAVLTAPLNIGLTGRNERVTRGVLGVFSHMRPKAGGQ